MNKVRVDVNRIHVHFGYLIIELLIALLLLCVFSSLIMYIQFSSSSLWRNTVQHKKALYYAQAHLDALLCKKPSPKINKQYTIERVYHNFLPQITTANFSCTESWYKKNYSLVSIICSWKDANNMSRNITLTSSAIHSYEK